MGAALALTGGQELLAESATETAWWYTGKAFEETLRKFSPADAALSSTRTLLVAVVLRHTWRSR